MFDLGLLERSWSLEKLTQVSCGKPETKGLDVIK